MSESETTPQSFHERLLQQLGAGGGTVEPGLPAASYPKLGYGSHAPVEEKVLSLAERDKYILEYGLVLLTQEVLAALAGMLKGKRVLDAGCGTAYLAHRLEEAGIYVVAADTYEDEIPFHTYWMPIQGVDAATLLPGPFDAVILSWPSHDTDFGLRVLQAMRPGQMLIYEGEIRGCCANGEFFDELCSDRWLGLEEETAALNEFHRQFACMRDRWLVMVRTENN